MEQALRIRTTWQKNDHKFIKHKKSLEEKKKKYRLSKLHKQAQEYRFMCTLKEKYCGKHSLHV